MSQIMKNKISRLTFCLSLLSSFAYSQSPAKLLQTLSQSKPDTNRIHLLLQLGDYYKPDIINSFNVSSGKIALNYYTRALNLSGQLHSQHLLNQSLLSIAQCYIRSVNWDMANKYYSKVTAYYHQTGDLRHEADTWGELGDPSWLTTESACNQFLNVHKKALSLYRIQKNELAAIGQMNQLADAYVYNGKLDSAENELIQVLYSYKAVQYKKLYETYFRLSRVYKTKGNLSSQLFYLLEMIKNFGQFGSKPEGVNYYYQMAGFYKDWGMYDKAFDWALKAVEADEKYNSYSYYYDYSKQVVEILLLLQKNKEALAFLDKTIKKHAPANSLEQCYADQYFGDCYSALGQLQKAGLYYQKAMAEWNSYITTTHDYSVYEDVWIHQKLGDFYFKTGDYKRSAFYFNQLKSIPINKVKPAVIGKLYLSIFRTDSALHNYVPAINHYQLYKKLNDTLFNTAKSGQIAEMQTKYETGQKVQAIKLLKSESKSQHAELKSLNLERNITFAGIAMLLVTGAIAYRGYRIKQRSIVQLRAKQQEINRQNLALQSLVEEKDGLLVEKDDLLHEKDSLLQEKDSLIGDKDWLLKEVHHRVKNNLQIVMSLLNTQSAFLENLDAISALRESQNRVQSIALIHQKLYMSDKAASIHMRAYINDLLLYLTDSYRTSKRRIRFVQTVDDINIDISQAVPLGLILNEAITNAIKYAFEPAGGEIFIGFGRSGDDMLMLTIADNGRGIPEALVMGKKTSLGMKIMRIFSKQLNGSYTITNTSGVTVSLEFPEDKLMNSLYRENVYKN
jgi:two-component sensor histidine kinase